MKRKRLYSIEIPAYEVSATNGADLRGKEDEMDGRACCFFKMIA
jgi:hypothetical protein